MVADRTIRFQAALCVSAFLAALNFFATTPFYPEMASDLQTSVPLLGQVVTLMAFISTALRLAVGPLADRYGYRWPLVLGLVAIAVNLLGMGLAPAYTVLLGLGIVGGLGDALAFSLPLAIAGKLFTGDARRRAIGLTIGALSTASIVGVPLLIAFGDLRGWRATLGMAGLVGALAAGFVAHSLPPGARKGATPLRVRGLLEAYVPLLAHPASLRLLAVTALRAMSWLGLLTYLGAHLGQVVGLDSREIGFVYMLAGAGYVVGSVAAGGG